MTNKKQFYENTSRLCSENENEKSHFENVKNVHAIFKYFYENIDLFPSLDEKFIETVRLKIVELSSKVQFPVRSDDVEYKDCAYRLHILFDKILQKI